MIKNIAIGAAVALGVIIMIKNRKQAKPIKLNGKRK
jgi:hypothetical protein